MSKRNSDAVAEVANKKSRGEIGTLLASEASWKDRRIAMVKKMFKDKGEEEDSDSDSVCQDPVEEAYREERRLDKMLKDEEEEEERRLAKMLKCIK